MHTRQTGQTEAQQALIGRFVDYHEAVNEALHTQTEQDTYELTAAGLDALENAVIVPDDAEAERSEDAGDQEFTPDTKEKADWVLSKIADARARAARIREHAEVMAKQAEAEAASLEWRFGPALQDLARRELTGKRKSLTLYHGVIGFRTKPAAVAIVDTDAALTWARENLPDAVTEALDKRALTAALKETGEVLPFAQFTEAEETFYIK